jgi:short-subunit dehydrogenase
MAEAEPKLAVVTGASRGIGYHLAHEFATNGFRVLICAEDDAILSACTTLRETGSVIDAVQADLATPQGVAALVEAIDSTGVPLDSIALNAGIGNAGRFAETSLDEDLQLINLNIVAVVRLAKAVLPGMVSRGAGRILVTSSIAATMPGPFYATYAASKSFDQSFAEAIRYEVKDQGVTVTALLPGPTDTDFFERAHMDGTTADEGPKDDPAEVARDGFKALMAGDDHVVAGSFRNKLQALGGKMLSDPAKAAIHAQQTKPPSEK